MIIAKTEPEQAADGSDADAEDQDDAEDEEDGEKEKKDQICVRFLEGLEWNMKYYTTGCPDWRWKYPYHYPPLFQDLVNHIPYTDKSFLSSSVGDNDSDKEKRSTPVSPMVQLCYVLPSESHQFLPISMKNMLQKEENFRDCYPKDAQFIWAFCKYFWEAHVDLPRINIELLEKRIQGGQGKGRLRSMTTG